MVGKANSKKRTLIEFDLANSGLPSNPTILSARLNLKWFTKVQGSGASWVDRTVQVHQLLVDWNEDEATKTYRTVGAQWQLEYGSINGTDAKQASESSAFFQESESLPRWKSWDLTELTQKWIDGTEGGADRRDRGRLSQRVPADGPTSSVQKSGTAVAICQQAR